LLLLQQTSSDITALVAVVDDLIEIAGLRPPKHMHALLPVVSGPDQASPNSLIEIRNPAHYY
jgi:hypothetical protein